MTRLRSIPSALALVLASPVWLPSSYNLQAQQSALEWEIAYTWEGVTNLSGGLRRGQLQLGNLDVTAQVNAGVASESLRGLTLFFYGLANHGNDPSTLAGDAQVVSNIAAPRAARLYEAWAEYILPGGRTSLLAGLYDLNSEFDAIQTAGLFFNSSHGIGVDFSQSGENGPSIFPITSVALRLRTVLGSSWYAQVIGLDGVPGLPDHPTHTHIVFDSTDGLLLVAEAGIVDPAETVSAGRAQDGTYSRRASVGYWTYTRKTGAILSGAAHRNQGIYAAVDGALSQETNDAAQGLAAFARVGFADREVNRFAWYFGAGAVYTGPLPGRNEDQLGLAIARATNSDSYRTALEAEGDSAEAAETTLELTWLAPVTDWLSMQLDAQYVMNPDTRADLRNALVAGLRVVLTF